MPDAENDVPVWCHEHLEPYCPRHGHPVENEAPASPFGPLDDVGHDGHAAQLNGLLADCPGCVAPPGGSDA